MRKARSFSDEKQFPFGAIFEVPPDLRSHMKAAGLRWANGIGKMYLPLGFDEAPVRAYFEHLLSQWNSARLLTNL
jgi:hypothetical protein